DTGGDRHPRLPGQRQGVAPAHDPGADDADPERTGREVVRHGGHRGLASSVFHAFSASDSACSADFLPVRNATISLSKSNRSCSSLPEPSEASVLSGNVLIKVAIATSAGVFGFADLSVKKGSSSAADADG